MKKFKRLLKTILHDLTVVLTPKFLMKYMFSCEDVVRTLDKDHPDHIATDKKKVYTNVKLQLHLLICTCCEDYQSQLKLLSKKSALLKMNLSADDELKLKASQQKILKELIKQVPPNK